MTNPEPNLTPEAETLLLEAMERDLSPTEQLRVQAILASHPELAHQIATFRHWHTELAALDQGEGVDLAEPMLARLEADARPLQLQRMAPMRRSRSFQLTSAQVRSLAAAAAILIITALTWTFVRSGPHAPKPQPRIAANDAARPEAMPPIPTHAGDANAPLLPDAAQRAVELAQSHWDEPETFEPTLAQAEQLLAQGRLVIRALAIDPKAAAVGLEALDRGLDVESTAWRFDAAVPEAIASRWRRTDPGPVFATDAATGQPMSLPSPKLIAVRSATLESSQTSIASLMHALEDLGWRVRLEAVAEPIELPASLDDALWFERSPSTWHALNSAPIVVDALDR